MVRHHPFSNRTVCLWVLFPYTVLRLCDIVHRYVSSQLETVASSKLGPLKLPSKQNPDREQQQQPTQQQQSSGLQQSKPRSSSAENARSSGSREGGERASKKSRDKEAAHGTDRDKLQSIYSTAPRTKHQSVWTKENLLRGSKRAQEAESVKEMRASVSNDIRQVLLSALLPRFRLMPACSSHPSLPCLHQQRRSRFVVVLCPRRSTPGSRRTRTCARAWIYNPRQSCTLWLSIPIVIVTLVVLPMPSFSSKMIISSMVPT